MTSASLIEFQCQTDNGTSFPLYSILCIYISDSFIHNVLYLWICKLDVHTRVYLYYIVFDWLLLSHLICPINSELWMWFRWSCVDMINKNINELQIVQGVKNVLDQLYSRIFLNYLFTEFVT